MKTIVVNSQKGGSGKSSLCRVLSVWLSQNQAEPVYLVDLDTQKTVAQWHEAREAEEPRRVELSIDGLGQGLHMLEKQGAGFVFIDTPPQASEQIDPVFLLADLVIVPIKPTPDDLKAAAVTVNRLKALDVRFLFVITQAIQNAKITAQAIAALSHHGAVAQTLIANRVIYPESFTDGRTPQELDPKGHAAKEIAQLWACINSFLHESMKLQKGVKHG
jgi:chromosome partitioning protein